MRYQNGKRETLCHPPETKIDRLPWEHAASKGLDDDTAGDETTNWFPPNDTVRSRIGRRTAYWPLPAPAAPDKSASASS